MKYLIFIFLTGTALGSSSQETVICPATPESQRPVYFDGIPDLTIIPSTPIERRSPVEVESPELLPESRLRRTYIINLGYNDPLISSSTPSKFTLFKDSIKNAMQKAKDKDISTEIRNLIGVLRILSTNEKNFTEENEFGYIQNFKNNLIWKISALEHEKANINSLA